MKWYWWAVGCLFISALAVFCFATNNSVGGTIDAAVATFYAIMAVFRYKNPPKRFRIDK